MYRHMLSLDPFLGPNLNGRVSQLERRLREGDFLPERVAGAGELTGLKILIPVYLLKLPPSSGRWYAECIDFKPHARAQSQSDLPTR